MKTSKRQKRIFISWALDSSRNDSLAFHLGARSYKIHYFKKRNMLLSPLKYILATCRTLGVLNKESPDIIFVQNPPVFAVLLIWLYCVFKKRKYVVDTHSGAFTYRRWVLFLWLYRFLAKHAIVNILHNESIAKKMVKWNAPTIVIGELPYQLETDRSFDFRKGFNVVFVNTFSKDEPIEEVLEAARKMPLVNFYITGSLNNASKSVITGASDNIILTNYLPKKDYVALLKDIDIVISLTNNDYTMQNGAYEALTLGRPIITSNWQVLHNTFYRGAICIDNKSDDIVKAINEIRKNYPYYIGEIRALQTELKTTWTKKLSNLLELLDSCYNKDS